MPLSQDISEWACQLKPGDIPDEVMMIAKQAVVDTLGVILAGAASEIGLVARDWIAARQLADGVRVMPFNVKTHPETAAMALGILAHALDLDDAHSSMGGHPSAVLVPVILALSHQVSATGRQALTAYVAGAEVAAHLGRAVAHNHYLSGWHATSTIGVLAASVTAAYLLHLRPLQTGHALGLAASMAGGLRINFGSDAKPLHVGQAAEHGLTAALLASAGLTSSRDALDGPLGYLQCFGGDAIDDVTPMADLGHHWELLDPGLDVKLYACCGAASRAIDALIDLLEETGLEGNDIEKIDALLSPHAAALLKFPEPKTVGEARFSLHHSLGSVLADGALGLKHFEPSAIDRLDIQGMRRRIQMGIHPELKERQFGFVFADLRVRTKDGRQFSRRSSAPRGGMQRPLTTDEMESKFLNCGRCFSEDRDWSTVLEALEGLNSDRDFESMLGSVWRSE